MATALIIGNSDGIGLELTKQLLSEGWRVVGVSRRASHPGAGDYSHHVMDVCSDEYSSRLRAVVDAEEQLDVCVYSAGVGEFLDLETLKLEHTVFETNLLGAVRTLQVVLPSMLRRRGGHFIGISSQGDQLVNPAAPSYGASKAALSSYLEGLAYAYRDKQVYVTNVRPGFVDTKMAKFPSKPFLVSAREAARQIRKCMCTRPIRYTFPKRLIMVLWLLRAATWLRRFRG